MYLIYSALKQPASPDAEELNHTHEKQLRYKAHITVCKKYREDIAAIQKYFPNWKPRFDQ